MKKLVAIVLVAVVGALLVATPALAATSLNRYEKQVLTLVNKQRVKRGLAKLRLNNKLIRAARAHSKDMGARQYMSHDSPAPNAETWSSRLIRYGYTKRGYRYWKAGENIAYGAGLYSSPYSVVRQWMRSKAHRAVILTGKFRDIGVGAVKTSNGYGSIDGTVWFFTIDLGRRIAR